jgi:hypothetical protein
MDVHQMLRGEFTLLTEAISSGVDPDPSGAFLTLLATVRVSHVQYADQVRAVVCYLLKLRKTTQRIKQMSAPKASQSSIATRRLVSLAA